MSRCFRVLACAVGFVHTARTSQQARRHLEQKFDDVSIQSGLDTLRNVLLLLNYPTMEHASTSQKIADSARLRVLGGRRSAPLAYERKNFYEEPDPVDWANSDKDQRIKSGDFPNAAKNVVTELPGPVKKFLDVFPPLLFAASIVTLVLSQEGAFGNGEEAIKAINEFVEWTDSFGPVEVTRQADWK
mmetsp:Transcript_29302/g.46769  ORF Transcript_29302/g.46769 Transcript_29302/m.46769 type:complete len:187 (+) Transcript_29302:41-601(+)